MSLQPKLFILPSLAPTNHQTSLLLLNYFCRVPSGLSSSLLWLASEAIVTFPQPSPGVVFKTILKTYISTNRDFPVWSQRFDMCSVNLNLKGSVCCSFYQLRNISKFFPAVSESETWWLFSPTGPLPLFTACKTLSTWKTSAERVFLLKLLFLQTKKKVCCDPVSSEPTFILSSQTYQASQWQLYNFIILIITSTTVQ